MGLGLERFVDPGFELLQRQATLARVTRQLRDGFLAVGVGDPDVLAGLALHDPGLANVPMARPAHGAPPAVPPAVRHDDRSTGAPREGRVTSDRWFLQPVRG